ncbi:39S ribosomal protein L33, mitochondrial isoform X2 [Grus americana]|uniref:39S ribosomal protein L33, mitochondrial isoform X2 n=1 Tax=Grus americana TaxID=9117 RepID=UPI0024082EF9|nr:39S ribosomal protein L33, mitochondrial isoform X2 [Grus americana]
MVGYIRGPNASLVSRLVSSANSFTIRPRKPLCWHYGGSQSRVAKSKSKYILVRMKSAAETGYCFNIRRLRLQEKLVLLRYDPIEYVIACFILG